MITYSQFRTEYRDLAQLVEQELATYGCTEDQFFALSENLNEDEGEGAHTNPVWKNVRAGASKYFSASHDMQKEYQKQATKMRGGRDIFTDEASNPKLAKSGKEIPSFKTKGLSLAPSTMSGVDVCPAATKECKASCLGASAGRAPMKSVKDARTERTHFALENPTHFYAHLDDHITKAKQAASKEGKKLAVRLNVTSDIPHEHLAPDLFKKHHDVQFYDYTKISGRTKNKNLPSNYHLTVSSSGLNHPDSNWHAVRQHLDRGGVASMVFAVKPGRNGKAAGELPTHVHDAETGKKYRVVDGDVHDHRHLDHAYNDAHHGEGLIAGLRIKGGGPNLERAGNFAVKPIESGDGTTHAVAHPKPKGQAAPPPSPEVQKHSPEAQPIKLHDFLKQKHTP